MPNPRYSDPHRNDQSRSFGVQGFWPWLTAALTALGLLLGGFFGYYWGVEHQKSAESRPPATTGSAPSQQR